MFSVKPIDKELIEKCGRETGTIVTIEEHNILGGLGGAVAEVSAELYPVSVKRLGVLDTFGESARDDEIGSLFEKYGLSAMKIVETVPSCKETRKKMKIFLDTANLASIRIYNDMGIVDGITTNPSLLYKEKQSPDSIMREIVELIKGPVSLEVIGTKSEEMIAEAHRLVKYGKNVVVKIPMIPDGLIAVKRLREEGIPTNVTLIFSANQAILAAKAGASYVSPFIGRLDDIGQEGMILIKEIVQIFRNYQYDTQTLVASIRHPLHVIDAAKLGADVVTLPPEILGKMMKHPLTENGLNSFLNDWKKIDKGLLI